MASVQDPDPRPLPGEPLALDLLNTQWLASGSPVDLFTTPEGTRTWLAAGGVTAAPAHGTREALITARQAIRDVLSGQGGTAARDRLNDVLGHGCLRLSLGPGTTTTQALEVDDPAWQPAVMAAVNVLDLLEQAPDRIRQCQHPACVLWFYDTTRNGTRRWCSMASCGNRAKAHRHYDRVKKTRLPGRPAVPAGTCPVGSGPVAVSRRSSAGSRSSSGRAQVMYEFA